MDIIGFLVPLQLNGVKKHLKHLVIAFYDTFVMKNILRKNAYKTNTCSTTWANISNIV